ncbi:LysE family transporter [Nesterenkonia muleiensis]|uniref:LysE family transporter n=1 Tax=Nesterenkonia muleiensis TaxID=2282648 RepID=UPI000E75D196|nr:LysE family transporter [Nesterenkonia muleiensis]
MLNIILTGLWIGLVFNVAPGPVFTESLRRGVRGGFRPALAVQIGSLVGDTFWAVLGLAGAAALLTQPQLHIPITLAGCLVLLFLGGQGVYAALKPPVADDAAQTVSATSTAAGGPLVAGALMSLASVWNVVYWGGAGGAVGGALGENAALGSLLIFFAAFMVTSLAWCFICAGFIAGLRRAMSQRWTRLVEGGAGAALIVMAVLLVIPVFEA